MMKGPDNVKGLTLDTTDRNDLSPSPTLFQMVTSPDAVEDSQEPLDSTDQEADIKISPLKVFGPQFSEFQATQFLETLAKKDVLLNQPILLAYTKTK